MTLRHPNIKSLQSSASIFEIRVGDFTPWWLWPNILSLDAPAIAALWQTLAAKDAGIVLSSASRVALPLSVWAIYLADRLFDSVRLEEGRSTARHSFYRNHRVLGLAMLISVSSLLAATLRLLPPAVLHNGLVVSALVGVYMLAVHALPGSGSRQFPKELAVSLIFSVGTVLSVWTRMYNASAILLPAVLFALLCWLNCAAIEVWEWRRCTHSDGLFPASSSGWLVRRLRTVSRLVFCLALLILPFTSFPLTLLSVGFCALAYCWLERVQASLDADALRVLADLPLLLPVLLIGWR